MSAATVLKYLKAFFGSFLPTKPPKPGLLIEVYTSDDVELTLKTHRNGAATEDIGQSAKP